LNSEAIDRTRETLAAINHEEWEAEKLNSTLGLTQYFMYGGLFLILAPVFLITLGLEKGLAFSVGGGAILLTVGVRLWRRRRALGAHPGAGETEESGRLANPEGTNGIGS